MKNKTNIKQGENKMETTTKRRRTTAAEVASRIRKELKEKYPSIKFSVKSKNYSGGNSIRVLYTDFLPIEEIEKDLNKYEDGYFDGMEDLYKYKPDEMEVLETGESKRVPRVKYLFVERNLSVQVTTTAMDFIYGNYDLTIFRQLNIHNAIYRLTRLMDLTNGFDYKKAKEININIFNC